MVVSIHARGGNWVEWGRLEETSKTELAAMFFAATRAGTEWVLVFFVLSGFLIGGRVIERLQQGTFDLHDYSIDRLSRIWVPLAPALGWSALVAFWIGDPVRCVDFFGNLTGFQGILVQNFAGNHPLWSLSYEIWFYILGGGLAAWIVGYRETRIAAIIVLGLALAVFSVLNVAFLFAWLSGALTYWLHKERRIPLLGAFGVVLIVTGYLVCQISSATVSIDTSIWRRWVPPNDVGIIILSMGVALVLPFIANCKPTTSFGKSMEVVGTKLAAFSYTLYLTHYPVLYLWDHYFPDRHAAITLGSVAQYQAKILSALLLAWVLYLPFERQTLRVRLLLKGYFPSRRNADKCAELDSAAIMPELDETQLFRGSEAGRS
jgi:peptidoglycan/LPS O-acetylase OafA/YrhL